MVAGDDTALSARRQEGLGVSAGQACEYGGAGGARRRLRPRGDGGSGGRRRRGNVILRPPPGSWADANGVTALRSGTLPEAGSAPSECAASPNDGADPGPLQKTSGHPDGHVRCDNPTPPPPGGWGALVGQRRRAPCPYPDIRCAGPLLVGSPSSAQGGTRFVSVTDGCTGCMGRAAGSAWRDEATRFTFRSAGRT